ncbi:MAG: TM2 domain-containing protein [Clostridia bacterium]|nr:TM2 domain-containing protein [Clostridia bacterium]
MAHYQTITSDKNKDTALLLCIFGGFLGLHYFYVGRMSKGLLLLFTCGIVGIFTWIPDILTISMGNFRDNVGAPLRATKQQNN